jgi:CDP-diacylglycerol--glycerol-3-phosphate 3-phosphatidyltransferase
MTKDQPVRPVPLVNLPNALTVTRLLLVPLFLLFLFQQDGQDAGWRWLAFGVFAVAAITDRYDGHIARKHGLVTNFGKVADPIADKALIGSALIGLSILHDLAWWVTVVILVREVGITLLRLALLRYEVIPASAGGKLKTLVQVFAIGFYLMPLPDFLNWFRITWMAAATILTVVTGGDYVVRAVKIVAHGRQSSAKPA